VINPTLRTLVGFNLYALFLAARHCSQFLCSGTKYGLESTILRALAGQVLTQTVQPVQSYGEIWSLYLSPLSYLPLAGMVFNPLASSSVNKNGRMTACGHMKTHWLHWKHLLESQTGS